MPVRRVGTEYGGRWPGRLVVVLLRLHVSHTVAGRALGKIDGGAEDQLEGQRKGLHLANPSPLLVPPVCSLARGTCGEEF